MYRVLGKAKEKLCGRVSISFIKWHGMESTECSNREWERMNMEWKLNIMEAPYGGSYARAEQDCIPAICVIHIDKKSLIRFSEHHMIMMIM